MPPGPTHTRPLPGYRYELELQQRARRGLSSVNVTFEDKEIFDLLQAHLSGERGKVLSQWDTFNILLADWIAARGGDLPDSLKGVRASLSPRR